MQPDTGTTRGPKNGWGQAGKLLTGNPQSQVTMQAQFDEPGTYTVQFSKADNPASNNPIFTVAIITWSVEGHFLTRKVNVADGVSVSGVGQAVRVQLNDATPNNLGTPTGEEYDVSVQVARGVRGTNKQPPILIGGESVPPSSVGSGGNGGLYTVLNGGTAVIPIPTGSGVISVYVTVAAAPPAPAPIAEMAVLANLNYAGLAFKMWDPRDFPDWVPIVPGTNSISLVNTSGQTTVWSVAFGIDG